MKRSPQLAAGTAAPPCSQAVMDVLKKLARVADIRDLYMGPPCHNNRHTDSAKIGGCTHGDDEQEITLGDCRTVRAWLANTRVDRQPSAEEGAEHDR